jgi:hypothetical protein
MSMLWSLVKAVDSPLAQCADPLFGVVGRDGCWQDLCDHMACSR